MKYLFIFCFMIASMELCFSKAIVATCKYNNKTITMSGSNLRSSLDIEREISDMKYKFHIENINSFSNSDDYVVIENKKGHKITYPMECR